MVLAAATNLDYHYYGVPPATAGGQLPPGAFIQGAAIHRVIDVEDTPTGLIFTTQGDNVERPDPPVSASAIDGRVVFAVPLLGLPVVWLKGAS